MESKESFNYDVVLVREDFERLKVSIIPYDLERANILERALQKPSSELTKEEQNDIRSAESTAECIRNIKVREARPRDEKMAEYRAVAEKIAKEIGRTTDEVLQACLAPEFLNPALPQKS